MVSKASDAIPTEVFKPFIKLAAKRGQFWADLFSLCHALGLRNSEARELKAEHVDLINGVVNLADSKQVRAFITKKAHKIVDQDWLTQGRKWLRNNISDPMASLLVMIPSDTKQLANLAAQYDLLGEFTKAQQAHYDSIIEQARAEASKVAPKGRTVDINGLPAIKQMLQKRISKYGNLCGFLFPAAELRSNRANSLEPVSRQAVYRTIKDIREQLESSSAKIKKSLNGIRTGLHSFRKAAVQRVIEITGDLVAGCLWIGHSSVATTEKYLNKSARRMTEINDKLASMNA